jgi:hypothetical protein
MKALELKPQLPSPFNIAIYFAPSNRDWNWLSEDKNTLLEIGSELKSKNIISNVFIIGDAIMEGTNNKAIRLAAARAGADAVLIIKGVSDIDRYNNILGPTYFLLLTLYFVPGTVIDSLFMVNASLWDVRNQYLYLSAEAEGFAKETRPWFFIEESRVIKSAKTDALEALVKEISFRLMRMGIKR